jgi:hypothetical protein
MAGDVSNSNSAMGLLIHDNEHEEREGDSSMLRVGGIEEEREGEIDLGEKPKTSKRALTRSFRRRKEMDASPSSSSPSKRIRREQEEETIQAHLLNHNHHEGGGEEESLQLEVTTESTTESTENGTQMGIIGENGTLGEGRETHGEIQLIIGDQGEVGVGEVDGGEIISTGEGETEGEGIGSSSSCSSSSSFSPVSSSSTKKVSKPRKLWRDEDMEIALGAIAAGEMTERAAAAHFGVPRATLNDYRHQRPGAGNRPGPRTLLSPAQESQLVIWIVQKATEASSSLLPPTSPSSSSSSCAFSPGGSFPAVSSPVTTSTPATSSLGEPSSSTIPEIDLGSLIQDNPSSSSASTISSTTRHRPVKRVGIPPELLSLPVISTLGMSLVHDKVKEITSSLEKPGGVTVTSGWWRRFIGRHPELKPYLSTSRTNRDTHSHPLGTPPVSLVPSFSPSSGTSDPLPLPLVETPAVSSTPSRMTSSSTSALLSGEVLTEADMPLEVEDETLSYEHSTTGAEVETSSSVVTPSSSSSSELTTSHHFQETKKRRVDL